MNRDSYPHLFDSRHPLPVCLHPSSRPHISFILFSSSRSLLPSSSSRFALPCHAVCSTHVLSSRTQSVRKDCCSNLFEPQILFYRLHRHQREAGSRERRLNVITVTVITFVVPIFLLPSSLISAAIRSASPFFSSFRCPFHHIHSVPALEPEHELIISISLSFCRLLTCSVNGTRGSRSGAAEAGGRRLVPLVHMVRVFPRVPTGKQARDRTG